MANWINDNGEYYDDHSVIYNDQLIINPTDEILIAAGYHQVEPSGPTAEDELNMAREIKLFQINDYDTSENVNIFYLAGHPMWLDAQTRQTLRISIESYQAIGAQNVTKWFGGQQFTFPISAWITMLNALEVYAAEALNITEMHRANIMAMDNVGEIEDYDITEGYPEILNLTPEILIKGL